MSERSLADSPASEAIPELYARHAEQIRRLGLGLLGGNAADADDLVQETFLRAWRAWDGFEGRSKPSTWLYTIARRTATRLRRPRSESRMLDVDRVGDRIPGNAALPRAIEALVAEEEEARVHEALERLPIRYRLPVSLKEIGGLTVEEIGEVLHLSDGTVKSRLHRGRTALADLLEPPSIPDPTKRRSRATSLCPSCRPAFGTEAFARHACEVAETGDERMLRRFLGLDTGATPV